MKRQEDKTAIYYDFENGEFVTINKSKGTWEYVDTFTGSQTWNSGVFVVENGVAYILFSAFKVQPRVIDTFKTEYAGCEWVESNPGSEENKM